MKALPAILVACAVGGVASWIYAMYSMAMMANSKTGRPPSKQATFLLARYWFSNEQLFEGENPWRRRLIIGVGCSFAFTAIAVVVALIGVSMQRRQQPLDVSVRDDGSIEADGRVFDDAKNFELFLRERKPMAAHVHPAKGATYGGVNGAMTAIQNVGGIDIGLRGNQQLK